MGIRYSAKAVTSERLERARHDPLLSVCCCPDDDVWAHNRRELPSVSLDKAWRDIQTLLGIDRFAFGEEALRPAAELLRGYSNGMDSYRRLLTPQQVEEAAVDFETFFRETGRTPGTADPGDYVEAHLEDARAFVASLVGTGLWVYYSIG
jgi:hypothetical protein